MHSSRMRTTRSSSHHEGGLHTRPPREQTPLGAGPPAPLGVSLETPRQTPQLPPGCGPGILQCMLGYHHPPWTDTHV